MCSSVCTSCWACAPHCVSQTREEQRRPERRPQPGGRPPAWGGGAPPAGVASPESQGAPRGVRGALSPTCCPPENSTWCCPAGNSPSVSKSAWDLHTQLPAHPWSTCKGIYPCIIYLSIHPSVHHLSMDLSIYLCVYHLSVHPSVSVWLSTYLLIHFHVWVLQLCLKLSSHVSRSSISSTSCGTYIAISEYFMKRKMIVGDLAAFEYMIEKPTVFPSYRQKNYLYICRSFMYM